MTQMLPKISAGIVLSVIVFASVPTQAADPDVSASRHVGVIKAPRQTLVVAQKSAAPQRTCDWVGPGGRAIYRYR
jgi:hypothetical protein